MSAALPRLFFAHANGFTPGAYEPMLQTLCGEFDIEAPALKPLRTGQAPTGGWQEIASDLAEQLDARPAPTIGVGHSLGAVALLMAAAAQPSRFKHLVLIEPPALPHWAAMLLRHAPAAIRQKGALAAAARRRNDRWASRDEAFAQERSRRWFAGVPDAVLSKVIEHGLCEDDGSWRLRFRKEWEARLYETPTSVWPLLKRPLPPITVLRGANSRVFEATVARRWQAMRSQDQVLTISDGGHLLPLEQPRHVAALISDVLQASLGR